MLRTVVLAVCAVEALMAAGVVVGGFTSNSDAAGDAMAAGYALIAAAAAVVFVVPAALLAWARKWLPFALALTLPPALLIVAAAA